MIELLSALPTWRVASGGAPCAVATVVSASGSVPRPVGTSMLVCPPAADSGGAPRILGSLSGGCVEGAVVAAALDVIDSGAPRIERFGYSAEDAFAVGLTCGGELEVHIAPLPVPALEELAEHDAAGAGTAVGAPLAVVRRLDEGTHDAGTHPALLGAPITGEPLAGALAPLFPGDPEAARRAAALVAPVLAQGVTGVVAVPLDDSCAGPDLGGPDPHLGGPDPDLDGPHPHLGGQDPHLGVRLLVESRLPAPRFIVVGANDFGAALIPAAQLLGYRVTLVDARPAFAGQARFACADEVVGSWPHEYLAAEAAAGRIDPRTALAVLSHDPKFDIPLLDAALRLDLAYLGAMGSRRSHEQRIAALLEAGHGPIDLGRLRSPIGLDLGAVSPAEVAVSVLAELVASRHPGASARPLRDSGGRIHAAPAGSDPQKVTSRRRGAPETAAKTQEAPAWT